MLYQLTPREFAVLKFLAMGYCNSQISQKLFVTTDEVVAVVLLVLRKLDVPNRIQAVEKAALLLQVERLV